MEHGVEVTREKWDKKTVMSIARAPTQVFVIRHYENTHYRSDITRNYVVVSPSPEYKP